MKNNLKKSIGTVLALAAGAALGDPSIHASEGGQPEKAREQIEASIVRHLQLHYRRLPTLSAIALPVVREDMAIAETHMSGKPCRFELTHDATQGWVVRYQQCDNE